MNCMMVYLTVLQSLIFCFGIVNSLPFSTSAKHEIRTFRWATTSNLEDAGCGTGLDLKEIYNYTVGNDLIENYISGVKLPGFTSPEYNKETCTRNASLFMLVGNPGIVWHLETGQCVKTKMITKPVSGKEPNLVYITAKFLTTGYECERDDPDVARFKFNIKRPQRLSYIENVDPKTGKQEEWCIRNWLGSQVQVVPDCNGNNPYSHFSMPELYFLEVV